MPSKSFNFNKILPDAIMQFVIAHRMYLCLPEIDYGRYRVLLQNTFQSSMPLLNAFFGITVSFFSLTGIFFVSALSEAKKINKALCVLCASEVNSYGVKLLFVSSMTTEKRPECMPSFLQAGLF